MIILKSKYLLPDHCQAYYSSSAGLAIIATESDIVSKQAMLSAAYRPSGAPLILTVMMASKHLILLVCTHAAKTISKPGCLKSNFQMLMRNEQKLLELRPTLTLSTDHSGPAEQFQNNTLRPILKMQHPLLEQLLVAEIHKHKSRFLQQKRPAQLEWIANAVRSNLQFRNRLIGVIIGQFTLEELQAFVALEPESTRRLAALIIQRLQSIDIAALQIDQHHSINTNPAQL